MLYKFIHTSQLSFNDKWGKLWISNCDFQRHFSVIGWYRAKWEVLESVIGQVDEPFEVTLLYTSCLGEDGVTVALDSLELIDCESGEFVFVMSDA